MFPAPGLRTWHGRGYGPPRTPSAAPVYFCTIVAPGIGIARAYLADQEQIGLRNGHDVNAFATQVRRWTGWNRHTRDLSVRAECRIVRAASGRYRQEARRHRTKGPSIREPLVSRLLIDESECLPLEIRAQSTLTEATYRDIDRRQLRESSLRLTNLGRRLSTALRTNTESCRPYCVNLEATIFSRFVLARRSTSRESHRGRCEPGISSNRASSSHRTR